MKQTCAAQEVQESACQARSGIYILFGVENASFYLLHTFTGRVTGVKRKYAVVETIRYALLR